MMRYMPPGCPAAEDEEKRVEDRTEVVVAVEVAAVDEEPVRSDMTAQRRCALETEEVR